MLTPLMIPVDIRTTSQIQVLKRFSTQFLFDDDIRLEVYLDFKRLSSETIDELINGIQEC